MGSKRSFQDFQNPRYIGIFMSQRERERTRERERARARERARKGKRERQGQGKGKGKGKRESTKALAILFLNRLGQSKKSVKYTVLYRKERYSMYS